VKFETEVLIRETEWIIRDDAYVFVGRGGYLDRLRRWLFLRWSKPYQEMVTASKVVRINDDSFRKIVCDAINKMRMYPKDVERIIVGPAQIGYALEELHHSFCFTCDVRWNDLHISQIFGIQVQVVPWFDGVLLLPKDK
jgi:hypothetical protein